MDAVHATGTAENAQSRTSGLGEVADEDLERRREAAQLELVGRADGTVGKGPWWRLRKERWQLVVSFAIIALVRPRFPLSFPFLPSNTARTA